MATKLEAVADTAKSAGKGGAKGGRKSGGKAAGKAAGKSAGKAAGTPTAEQAERRKKRMDRMAAANKVTVTFQTEVRRYLAARARDEGMDMGHFLQKLAESHVLETAPAGDPLAAQIGARRGVIDHVIKLAQAMDQEGAFDADFILRVMQRAHANPAFAGMYTAAVTEAGKPKLTSRAGVALNQQLGRLIKRAVGAKSKRDAEGKILRAQVKDEVITSYTLLEKSDA